MEVGRVGCLDLCAAGPVVRVPETWPPVRARPADEVDGVVEALRDLRPGDASAPQAPLLSRQLRVVTENSGRIDPESLDNYLAVGGYRALGVP
jgi:bidirectional [NiFe] hydrogenase diaphorase subunit